MNKELNQQESSDWELTSQWLQSLNKNILQYVTDNTERRNFIQCFQNSEKKEYFEKSNQKWIAKKVEGKELEKKMRNVLGNLNRTPKEKIAESSTNVTKQTIPKTKVEFEELIVQKKTDILKQIQEQQMNLARFGNGNNKVLVSVYLPKKLAFIMNQIYLMNGKSILSKSEIYSEAVKQFLGNTIIDAFPDEIELGDD